MTANLPPPAHRGPDGTGSYFDSYTADQLRAYGEACAALAAPAVPAPDGWKLVPLEPTAEMLAAYLKANHTYWKEMDEGPAPIGKWRNGTPAEATAESYHAMLAAAPQAQPAAQPLTDEQVAALVAQVQGPPWLTVEQLIRAVERAHGIGKGSA